MFRVPDELLWQLRLRYRLPPCQLQLHYQRVNLWFLQSSRLLRLHRQWTRPHGSLREYLYDPDKYVVPARLRNMQSRVLAELT